MSRQPGATCAAIASPGRKLASAASSDRMESSPEGTASRRRAEIGFRRAASISWPHSARDGLSHPGAPAGYRSARGRGCLPRIRRSRRSGRIVGLSVKVGPVHLPFLNSPEQARAMYEGGRANAVARRYARFWVAVLGRGLLPGRGAVLEVPGRNSGQPRRFPLVEARIDRDRYLVSMLGEECNWVRNVRAVDGVVKLR